MINLQDLGQIGSRLDSTIHFTLIRFIYQVLSHKLSNAEIILIMITCLFFLSTKSKEFLQAHVVLIVDVLESLSSGLLGQALINIATSNEVILQPQIQHPAKLFEEFAMVTSMLFFASIIPHHLQKKEYINRAITILLYMYTDATQSIVNRLAFKWTAGFVCVLIFVSLHRCDHILCQTKTLQYFVKAINMVVVNIVLTSVSKIDVDSSDVHTQTVLLLLFLFFVDSLSHLIPVLQESRNFAIWKGAQMLFVVYNELNVQPILTFLMAILVVMVHTVILTWIPSIQKQQTAIIEVFLLVVVNVVIDQLGDYTMKVYSVENSLLLFIYILSIHAFSRYIL